MKFHNVFAVGKLVRKRTHPVSLAAIDGLVLGIGDLHIAASIDDVSIHKAWSGSQTLPLSRCKGRWRQL